MFNNKTEERVEMEMEDDSDSGKCSRPSKVLLFFFNLIIWLGSCALLALGIYSLVDSPYIRPLMGETLMMMAAVVMIVVGSVGFLIAFMGCCGALNNSKCLVLTYVIVLIFLLTILLVGGILGLTFTDRAENAAVTFMRKKMMKYDPAKENSKIVEAWDDMQRSMKCCGVLNFKEWENNNENFPTETGDKLPSSCCVVNATIPTPTRSCLRDNQESFIYSKGCFEAATELVKKYSPIIGIVGAVVAFCMILGVMLGFVVYKRL